MSKVKISVLMPAYNAGLYISEAIESILNQTFSDFECIIIDDGSTDGTWRIIEKFIKSDPRIKAFRNNSNIGISRTRNKLISIASGQYIIWQDADDVSVPYRIEKQYNYMELHPEVGICGGGLQFFNNTGNTTKRLYSEKDTEIRKNIFRYSPVSQTASIVRTLAIKKVGGFNEQLNVAEDLDISFKLGKIYQFGNLPEILVRYRESDSSITFRKLRDMELSTLKIRWENHKSNYYIMTFGDKLYNICQFFSIWIMPTKLKIILFNFIRNI